MLNADLKWIPKNALFAWRSVLTVSFRAFFLCMLCSQLVLAEEVAVQREAATAVEWQSLSSEQQVFLAGLQSSWSGLAPRKQQRFARLSAKYIGLSPQNKKRFLRRFEAWQNMDRSQRQRAVGSYKRFKRLPAKQRQRLWKRYKQFQSLSAEEKAQLRASWQADGRRDQKKTKKLQGDTPTSQVDSERMRSEDWDQRKIERLELRLERLREKRAAKQGQQAE